MKTIRNRVEKIGSDEEQFIEIDIANAPRIYVSKIKSRQGGEQEEPIDLELKKGAEPTKKPKKKGKGLKKAKKLAMEAAAKNATITTKKPKKKGQKNQKKTPDDVTKQPRHLVGKTTVTPGPRRDHPSSWINGILDPNDPNFTNQGQIRGYTMQKASRKPQTTTPSGVVQSSDSEEEQLKISESTRMMWDMDELKYTTFLAPKTTEHTKPSGDGIQKAQEEKEEDPGIQNPRILEAMTTTSTTTEKAIVVSWGLGTRNAPGIQKCARDPESRQSTINASRI